MIRTIRVRVHSGPHFSSYFAPKEREKRRLAGMVKEKMCALIHVEALITMLNAGLDVKALDN